METVKQAATPSVENESFWKHHIKSQAESGVSKSIYCQRHKMSYDRFKYWSRKLACGGLVPVKVGAACAPASVPKPPTEPVALGTLTLKNGNCLRIYDEQALTLILEKYC